MPQFPETGISYEAWSDPGFCAKPCQDQISTSTFGECVLEKADAGRHRCHIVMCGKALPALGESNLEMPRATYAC